MAAATSQYYLLRNVASHVTELMASARMRLTIAMRPKEGKTAKIVEALPWTGEDFLSSDSLGDLTSLQSPEHPDVSFTLNQTVNDLSWRKYFVRLPNTHNKVLTFVHLNQL